MHPSCSLTHAGGMVGVDHVFEALGGDTPLARGRT